MQRNYRNYDEKKVITVQKTLRGFLSRKKYSIPPLPQSSQTDHPTFAIGNDPNMPSLAQYHEPQSKICLIGTSGLRSVDMACELGNVNQIPKIIIVDNSKKVYAFWYAVRKFMEDNNLTATQNDFFINLQPFLKTIKNLYRDLVNDTTLVTKIAYGVTYPEQDIEKYFNELFKKFGYDYVRAVIKHVSLIQESWANLTFFYKLKNILKYHGIDKVYMYPSNIVPCMNRTTGINILAIIKRVSPLLTIHTNYCDTHKLPEQVYFFSKDIYKESGVKIYGRFFSGKCIEALKENGMPKIYDKDIVYK